MVEINKEALELAKLSADRFEDRVQELKDRNKVIGHEATIYDVMALFKEFNIEKAERAENIRTNTINQVLGGQKG